MTTWGEYAALWLFASKKKLWRDYRSIPNEVDILEDAWMTSELVSKAKRIILIKESLYFYDKTNTTSITHDYNSQNLCRLAFAYYKIWIKRNETCLIGIPFTIPRIRKWIVYAY